MKSSQQRQIFWKNSRKDFSMEWRNSGSDGWSLNACIIWIIWLKWTLWKERRRKSYLESNVLKNRELTPVPLDHNTWVVGLSCAGRQKHVLPLSATLIYSVMTSAGYQSITLRTSCVLFLSNTQMSTINSTRNQIIRCSPVNSNG